MSCPHSRQHACRALANADFSKHKLACTHKRHRSVRSLPLSLSLSLSLSQSGLQLPSFLPALFFLETKQLVRGHYPSGRASERLPVPRSRSYSSQGGCARTDQICELEVTDATCFGRPHSLSAASRPTRGGSKRQAAIFSPNLANRCPSPVAVTAAAAAARRAVRPDDVATLHSRSLARPRQFSSPSQCCCWQHLSNFTNAHCTHNTRVCSRQSIWLALDLLSPSLLNPCSYLTGSVCRPGLPACQPI